MDREEADGADGVEAVCEWLATEAGLCEEEMHEARPLLLRERVYTVHRLELLRQEGCLREVFGARITCRLVSDALGRREAATLPPAAPSLPATPPAAEATQARAAEASQALLAALDTRDVPSIRTLLAAYAESVQGVQLQSSAFELLARVGAAKEAELDTLISRMRALAAERRASGPAGLARGAAASPPLPSPPEGHLFTPEAESRAWAGASDGVAYSGVVEDARYFQYWGFTPKTTVEMMKRAYLT